MSKTILCLAELKQHKTTKNFKALYDVSCVPLFGVVLHILKHHQEAEECLQEVYLKVWDNIDSYQEDKANPMTWMRNIAKNHAIDCLRKSKNTKKNIDIDDKNQPEFVSQMLGNIDALEQADNTQNLHTCLKQLKEKAMNALMMTYFYGLSYEQVATHLSIPIGTVKSRINRSIEKLKYCLESL